MNYTEDKYITTRKVLLVLVGILTVLPLAPLINRYIPPLLLGDWNLDLTLSIALAAALTWLLLRLFRFLLIPAVALLVLVLIYNQLTNGYGFGRIMTDYRTMVENNWGRKSQKETNLVLTPTIFEGPLTKTVKALQSKVDSKDSMVRNFAVQHSLDYFDEYHTKYGPIVRQLSLFKYINSRFKYVSDSERDEYFATARETIQNGMGGDCDDHSILMVSTLKSIGGHCRMILTEGHLYPELYCGDEKSFERMQQAIIHLFGDQNIDNIFYHEQNGQYWINLDYTAKYPGGPYMSEKAYAIIDL
ncbi:MAG: transglutaminase family protein [Candidatus Pseudobacter hemicellulosilyticus]|uniref:Transglutaminase family protein n=1 Tax=Candidatus Pseudobacter hemicellulosilyticus TaxID=3121375 RepID=A0AAJ5WPM5_9BACT|nr:MAG: transglutaminase family protein [Pseudobacter sp.]